MYFLYFVKNMKIRVRIYFNLLKINIYGFIFFSFKIIKKKLVKVFIFVIYFIKIMCFCNFLYI